MNQQEFYMNTATICWDCAKAIGGCSWSNSLKPVKGWTAVKVKKTETESFRVIKCPEFERDALNFGTKRLPKDGEKDEKNFVHYL